MSERLGGAVTARLAVLVGSMRAGGARLGVGDLVTAHRALAAVDPASRADSYLALRAALCKRRADLEVFDAAFDGVFPAPDPQPLLDEAARMAVPRIGVPMPPGESGAALDEAPVPAAWSEVEMLRERDFAEMSDAERALAVRMVRRIALRGPMRRSRRLRPSRRRGDHPDLRRTVRSSLRYGGEPVERHWREPTLKPRPVVLVCDVSGSMDPYARMLLQYMRAWVAAPRRRAEAFVFGTRLTRVTRELEGRDPDRLAAEMARLARCSHALVWLNPLKAHPEYEPLTRGMVAALPHVDHFLAGNSVASLEELALLLEEGIG